MTSKQMQLLEKIAMQTAQLFKNVPLERMPEVIRGWQERSVKSLSKANSLEKSVSAAVAEGLARAAEAKLGGNLADFKKALAGEPGAAARFMRGFHAEEVPGILAGRHYNIPPATDSSARGSGGPTMDIDVGEGVVPVSDAGEDQPCPSFQCS
jgi:hypothetical protein